MNTSFLDYYKIILEKVSFDRALFMKEYSKALRNLNNNEINNLNTWLASRGMIHIPIQPPPPATPRVNNATHYVS